MEVVATVSSVAGILSLLGAAIDNTRNLKDFLLDISSASEIVGRFLCDINEILRTLDAVNGLVESFPSGFNVPHLAFLQAQLEDYTKDVYLWFKTARSLRPTSDAGARAWFKKFWVAASMKSVRDIRGELDRHNQAINLSLSILGRTLDVSTSKKLNSIGGTIEHGTAASLSQIAEQNIVLERIQAYTETDLQTSAASVRSLHSIATSLSRIESLASSAARTSASEKAFGPGSPRSTSWTGPNRFDSGYYSIARRSGSSQASRRVSNRMMKSSPSMPRISNTKLSLLQDEKISEASWESKSQGSNPDETANLWSDEFEDTECIKPEPSTLPDNADNILGHGPQIDPSLNEQYHFFHQLTQRLTAAIYAPTVVKYINLIQTVKDYENKISALNLLKFGSNIHEEAITKSPDMPVQCDLYMLRHKRDALQDRLGILRNELQILRRRCITEGHMLHDIDQRFGPSQLTDTPSMSEDWETYFSSVQVPRQSPGEVLGFEDQRTNSKLLGKWSSHRDRVNRWLMHCLQTDHTQAQLHKSMLADAPKNDTDWARQVLQHWYSDEAATGGELQVSLSAGAVDSHTADSSRMIPGVQGSVKTYQREGFDFDFF